MSQKQNTPYHARIPMSELIILLDKLNAQLGICGALVVERYNQLKKEDFLERYAEYITLPDENDQEGEKNSAAKMTGKRALVQHHASLANIITQIQHDLFDMKTMLIDKDYTSSSRIDGKAIKWLDNISANVASALPAIKEPTLPIGNQMATNFFLAHNWCQHVQVAYEASVNNASESEIFYYLSALARFLMVWGWWSNLTHGEKVWPWSPKSETPQDSVAEPEEAT